MAFGHLQAKDFADLSTGNLNVRAIEQEARMHLGKQPILVILYANAIAHNIAIAATQAMQRDFLAVCALRIDDYSEKDLLKALPRMLKTYNFLKPERVQMMEREISLTSALQGILPLYLMYHPDGTFAAAHTYKVRETAVEEYLSVFKLWAQEALGL